MNNFSLVNAKTVAEAASALGSGKAAVLAGGTDLLTTLRDYINPTQPETLVNIKSIPNLDYIKEDGGCSRLEPSPSWPISRIQQWSRASGPRWRQPPRPSARPSSAIWALSAATCARNAGAGTTGA